MTNVLVVISRRSIFDILNTHNLSLAVVAVLLASPLDGIPSYGRPLC